MFQKRKPFCNTLHHHLLHLEYNDMVFVCEYSTFNMSITFFLVSFDGFDLVLWTKNIIIIRKMSTAGYQCTLPFAMAMTQKSIDILGFKRVKRSSHASPLGPRRVPKFTQLQDSMSPLKFAHKSVLFLGPRI